MYLKGSVAPDGNMINMKIENRRARHEYHIDEIFEAGVCLEGWEVKAIRAGRMQLQEAYVKLLDGKPCLIGAHITPLAHTSTHTLVDPTRTRVLLLNSKEIRHLHSQVTRAGFTMVPLDIHFTKGRVKLNMALAKGKQNHDKRATIKNADWTREQSRIMKQNSR